MIKAEFYSGDDVVTIEGFYNPDRNWNGWALPLFTKENVMAFLEETNQGEFFYQEQTDSIHWEMPEYDFDTYAQGDDYNIDGEVMHLYPFGNYYLGWDVV